jgi:hypothetical protein
MDAVADVPVAASFAGFQHLAFAGFEYFAFTGFQCSVFAYASLVSSACARMAMVG